jgi:hypothetical protein
MQPFSLSLRDVNEWISWTIFRSDVEIPGVLWWCNQERRWIPQIHQDLAPPWDPKNPDPFPPHLTNKELLFFISRPVPKIHKIHKNTSGRPSETDKKLLQTLFSRYRVRRLAIFAPEGWYFMKLDQSKQSNCRRHYSPIINKKCKSFLFHPTQWSEPTLPPHHLIHIQRFHYPSVATTATAARTDADIGGVVEK